MSLTPRAAGMAALAVIVVFAGIAVAILPAAPADAQTGPNATSANGPQVAAGPFMHDLRLTPWAVPTPLPSLDPNAAIAATPSPTPTATPTPTPAPTAKPKPKPRLKPRPIVYADTVAGARAYARARVGNRQFNPIQVEQVDPRLSLDHEKFGEPCAKFFLDELVLQLA